MLRTLDDLVLQFLSPSNNSHDYRETFQPQQALKILERVFAAARSRPYLPDLHADVVPRILGATDTYKTCTRVSIDDVVVMRSDGDRNSCCASIEIVSLNTVEKGVHKSPVLDLSLARSAKSSAAACSVHFILHVIELRERR